MKHQLLSIPKNHIIFRKKAAEITKVPIKFKQTYREGAAVRVTINSQTIDQKNTNSRT